MPDPGRDLTLDDLPRPPFFKLVGADGATFVLRDGDCCYYVDEDAISPLWKGQRFPLEACISGEFLPAITRHCPSGLALATNW